MEDSVRRTLGAESSAGNSGNQPAFLAGFCTRHRLAKQHSLIGGWFSPHLRHLLLVNRPPIHRVPIVWILVCVPLETRGNLAACLA